jgi:hypothetical protein
MSLRGGAIFHKARSHHFPAATRQEPIAHARFGFQPARGGRIITEFLSQFAQHDAQVMRVLHARASPYFAQHCWLTTRPAWRTSRAVRRTHCESVKAARRQGDVAQAKVQVQKLNFRLCFAAILPAMLIPHSLSLLPRPEREPLCVEP